jgi:hypothetical protein
VCDSRREADSECSDQSCNPRHQALLFIREAPSKTFAASSNCADFNDLTRSANLALRLVPRN